MTICHHQRKPYGHRIERLPAVWRFSWMKGGVPCERFEADRTKAMAFCQRHGLVFPDAAENIRKP